MNTILCAVGIGLVATSAWASAKTQKCLRCHAELHGARTAAVNHPVRHGAGEFECTGCHRDHATTADSKGDQHQLNTSPQELCQSCHAAEQHKEFVHEPAKLSCVICHDPHGDGGGNLRAQGNALCLECHSAASKSKFETDAPVQLFKGQVTLPARPFRELKLLDLPRNLGHPVSGHPVERAADANWPAVSCWFCHSPHGANNSPVFLVTEAQDSVSLCQKCHQ